MTEGHDEATDYVDINDRLHEPKLHEFPVAMRSGETPVPIPNTTVKTRAAESTILATVWKDRWLPDLKRKSF